MSTRVSSKPIIIPSNVEVKVEAEVVKIKGSKGELSQKLASGISVNVEDNVMTVVVAEDADNGNALGGTMRALLNNNVLGVTEGFEKKLKLVGVGYRAQAGKEGKFDKLNLTLGLSHPLNFVAPEGITLEAPSATDITVRGVDKQVVGQVAANIRGIHKGVRKPEPYKGKGIRYADETIQLKETKKK
tara:strand:- start:16908 stop:17468 length:561 start_codon:yes stop_codon:yes gene_type:complete